MKYVQCSNCMFSTKHYKTFRELQTLVESKGGLLRKTPDGPYYLCPQCREPGTLEVKEEENDLEPVGWAPPAEGPAVPQVVGMFDEIEAMPEANPRFRAEFHLEEALDQVVVLPEPILPQLVGDGHGVDAVNIREEVLREAAENMRVELDREIMNEMNEEIFRNTRIPQGLDNRNPG